ncbi:MAG: DUF4386 domain-containing protein [Devosia sp.]
MTSQTMTMDDADLRPARLGRVATVAGLASKGAARITGLLYLCVAIFGGFAEGFVDPKMYAAGDAATTAMNVVTNAGLVRLGVVSDLLDQAFYIFTAMAFYLLLKHVSQRAAAALLIFAGLAVAIGSLNALFLFEGLQIATSATYVTAWGATGVNAMVLLMLDMQHYGLLIAQIFFGLWLAPMGYLAYKSGQFPKPLGILLIVASACYLVDLLAAFLVPEFGLMIHGFVVIPCAVAEIWVVLYLLIIGVRTPKKSPIANA